MNEDININSDDSDDVWPNAFTDTGYRNNPWPFETNNSSITINLDLLQAERVAVEVIKRHLDDIYGREHAHAFNPGSFYHEEDREYDRKLKKAFRRVLKYFGHEE